MHVEKVQDSERITLHPALIPVPILRPDDELEGSNMVVILDINA